VSNNSSIISSGFITTVGLQFIIPELGAAFLVILLVKKCAHGIIIICTLELNARSVDAPILQEATGIINVRKWITSGRMQHDRIRSFNVRLERICDLPTVINRTIPGIRATSFRATIGDTPTRIIRRISTVCKSSQIVGTLFRPWGFKVVKTHEGKLGIVTFFLLDTGGGFVG
jgi:hypothetical protein